MSLSGAPVTVVLLLANFGIYAAFALSGGGFVNADPQLLIRWGSNFGPYTADGEWWRLLSAAFLHGGIVHLLVNMFTLFDVGSLCERVYGSRRYLVLYLLSGLLGSAASMWWNPSVNSVGASGALFGVLGAAFVYMLDRRNGVPVSEMKSHATSMGVFIVYGVVNGMIATGIDNAAHLGGLAAGALLGFALSRQGSAAAAAGGVAACVVAIVALVALTPNLRGSYEQERRFSEDLSAFTKEEDRLVKEMRELIGKARAAGADHAALRPAVDAIVTRWEAEHRRFTAYRLEPQSRFYTLHEHLVAYTGLRHRAMAVLGQAFSNPADSRARVEEFNRLMKEGDAIVERIKQRSAKEKKK
jgi:rhomboid protease GluP